MHPSSTAHVYSQWESFHSMCRARDGSVPQCRHSNGIHEVITVMVEGGDRKARWPQPVWPGGFLYVDRSNLD